MSDTALDASRILVGLPLATFAAEGPLMWGSTRRLSADPVRSSRSHFVKISSSRWICALLLVPIPWASPIWALPFLSVLAPCERSACGSCGRRQCATLEDAGERGDSPSSHDSRSLWSASNTASKTS